VKVIRNLFYSYLIDFFQYCVKVEGEAIILNIFTDYMPKDEKNNIELKYRRLASFPELNPNPVLEIDASGKIIYANPATKRVLKELGLKADADVFIPGNIEIILKSLRTKKSGDFHLEVPVGKAIFAERICLTQEFNSIRVYASDVTRKKQAEKELKELNQQLEERVEKRTKEITLSNKKLQESKIRYEELWNNAPVAYHILDLEGIIIQVNKTEADMLGCGVEEMIGKSIFSFIKPNQENLARKRFKLKLSQRQVSKDENRIYLKKNGSSIYVSINDVLEYDRRGKVVGVKTTMVDITDRKIAEETIYKNNRDLEMLSACNEALVYATQEEKLLQNICSIIVKKGGYKLTWVGMAEQNKEKTVLPVAQKGFNDGYLERVEISWDKENPKGRGPTGTAINSGKPQIGKYFSKDNRLNPWRKEALKRGYTSSIALPLIAQKKVLGALSIYSADREAFDKKETKLLMQLADDLAFGIMALRTRKAHLEDHQYLEVNNKLLKLSSRSDTRKEYLDAVVKYIRKISEGSYVGIRILNKAGFIPYDSYIGFTKEFWQSENWLSLQKDQCACIRVIAGKPDPQDMPAMTEKGSFCTLDSLQFVKKLTVKEQERFRGKCVRCGFASIAIIPIRCKEKTIGAIHMADKKISAFSPKKIEFIESLTPIIGEAVEKFNAADNLKDKEKNYRDLVENANSIIVRLDAKGRIEFFNEFAEKFFGFSEKELQEQHIVGTLIPKDKSSGKEFESFLRSSAKGKRKNSINETESVKKNGEHVWVSWNHKPIFDSEKKLSGILSVGTDITDRKHKEEYLVESYQHLGIINRKISFLRELDQLAHEFRDKKDVARHIISSLVNLSTAKYGVLFKSEEGRDKILRLMSSIGIEKNKEREIKIMDGRNSEIIEILEKERKIFQGNCSEFDIGKLSVDKKLEHFLTMPIHWENKLRAVLFLGFPEKKQFSKQELDFFNVFSTHAAFVLANTGFFKKAEK
jgi:PAS domain S-box-containing protein